MTTNQFTYSEAQKPSSNSKTLIETLLMYFRGSEKDTKNVHVKPDIYILTKPGTSGFIKYTSDNGSGKPELTMTFPPENNVIFQTFSQTDKKTEFVAKLETPKSKFKTERTNSYTINPSSEENKVDRSTQTITELQQTPSNIFQNVELQKLDLPKGSFINKGKEETQQGKSTPELESICAERVNVNGESALLLSLTYQDSNKNDDSTPCLLFNHNGTFYSPKAFLRALQTKIDKSKLFKMLLMSRNGKHVHIGTLEGVSGETAEKIANVFQSFEVNEVKQTCNIKENIKIINEEIDKSTSSGGLESQVVSPKIVETNQKASNDTRTIDQDENVPISSTRVPAKCVKRKQSKLSMWKIYLQSQDDNVRKLVHEYFNDDLVCKAVYEFFGKDIHPWKKFPFQRPNVPWPSMYPLLPCELYYLADDETMDEQLE